MRRGKEPLDRALTSLDSGSPAVSGTTFRALTVRAGVSPRTPGALLTAEDWYQISRQLAGQRRVPG